MHKILFVCHGNICRSPMGEFLMKEAVRRLGEEKVFTIASAAVSQEELGNGVYPPVKKILTRLGIDCSQKRARQIKRQDLEEWDLIILMDRLNLSYLSGLLPEYPEDKVKLLLSFVDPSHVRDVDDPWYTRDFERTKDEISQGVAALLKKLCPMHSNEEIERACTFN